MKGRERPSGPAWNCFRAEFRRRWRGRKIARALGWLLLIVVLQLAPSLAVQYFSRRLGTMPGGLWISVLAGLFSLFSPFGLAFFGGFRSASPEIRSYFLIQAIVALPLLACHFLMPAAAASSIAPDREQRRLSELILAGLTPRQILVAKGLAAVLPFLIAVVCAAVASGAVYLQARITGPGSSDEGWSRTMGLTLLSGSAVRIASLLPGAAIQVCISALSRRTRSAIAICYVFEFLLIPLLHVVSQLGWMLALSLSDGLRSATQDGLSLFLNAVAPQLTALLLESVALFLLWPRALRALAYPDEVTGSASIRDGK